MTSIASISLSGMNAAQTAFDVSAHNIANLQTPGFRRQQGVQSGAPDGGVIAERINASQPGDDIEADVVAQLQAKNRVLANLAVFRASDKMLGALLDAQS